MYPHDRVFAVTLGRLIPKQILPNHFTIFRLLATPGVLFLLVQQEYFWGLIAFFFVALTDMIDGSLARTRDQITPWGIFFDPIADKLLIGSVGILLAIRYFHPTLILLALLFDVAPAMLGGLRKYQGNPLVSANWWGKSKMIFQCLSFTLLLAGLAFGVPWLPGVAEVVMMIATALAVMALFTYSL